MGLFGKRVFGKDYDHTQLDQWSLALADLFRRNLESAYTAMWQAWQKGEAPRGFAVT